VITIYPAVGTINSGTKPYEASFYAHIDFVPGTFVWFVNGVPRYAGNTHSPGPLGTYAIGGPTIDISSAATTIRVDIYRAVGGALATETYTTAEQRDPASVTVSLSDQKDGNEIVHGVSIPDTPVLSPVSGVNQLDLTWSKISTGRDALSRVWLRAAVSDQTGSISRVTVDWGDGSTDNHDYDDLRDVLLDTSHNYANTTGSKSISVYHATALGQTPGPTGTLGVTITADATGWYAQQYEISRYRSHIGFQQTNPVGWREIEDNDRDVEFYDVRRANTYFCRLRLRELDPTGRPIRTSAYSAIAYTGAW